MYLLFISSIDIGSFKSMVQILFSEKQHLEMEVSVLLEVNEGTILCFVMHPAYGYSSFIVLLRKQHLSVIAL